MRINLNCARDVPIERMVGKSEYTLNKWHISKSSIAINKHLLCRQTVMASPYILNKYRLTQM